MGREEKRQRIYEAALRLFSEAGYKETTVEAIATDLGMTKGNLYLYAKNKRDLYNSSVAWALMRWQQRAKAEADKEESAPAKLYAYFNAGYHYLESDAVLRKLIISDPSLFPLTEKDDTFKDINDASKGILLGYIREGIKAGELREFEAEGVVELLYPFYVMLVVRRYVVMEKTPSQKDLDNAFELILYGILDS